MDGIELMADDQKLIRELGDAEKWLDGVCPNNVTDSELNLDRLKRHVRLAVQEAWLARELQTNHRTPDSLSASISGRIKQQLTATDAKHTTKRRGKLPWIFRPWQLGALATAAAIAIVAVGLGLYYPSTHEDSYVLLDSLTEDSLFSNDIDMSLTALTEELDDFSWTLQSLDEDIDSDIQDAYDQIEAVDIESPNFDIGIGIES